MTNLYIIGHDGAKTSEALSAFWPRVLFRAMEQRLNELEAEHAELKREHERLTQRCESLQRMIDEME